MWGCNNDRTHKASANHKSMEIVAILNCLVVTTYSDRYVCQLSRVLDFGTSSFYSSRPRYSDRLLQPMFTHLRILIERLPRSKAPRAVDRSSKVMRWVREGILAPMPVNSVFVRGNIVNERLVSLS